MGSDSSIPRSDLQNWFFKEYDSSLQFDAHNFEVLKKMLSTCNLKTYDAGRLQGMARFWPNLRSKLRAQRSTPDGSGWFILENSLKLL